MKARFIETRSDTTPDLRRDVRMLAQQLGDLTMSKDLGVWTIGTTVTKVPHGMKDAPARWLAGNLSAAATIRQTQAADAKFLYLIADIPATASSLLVTVALGSNGAGPVTLTGVKVGDKVIGVANLTAPGDLKTSFEATITVAGQIQQTSAADLSAKQIQFMVIEQAAVMAAITVW